MVRLLAPRPTTPPPLSWAAVVAPPMLIAPPFIVTVPRVAPALKFTVPPVVVVVGIVGARVKLVVPPLIVAVAAAVTFGRLAVPPLVVTLLTAAYGPRLAVPPLVVTFGVVPSAVMLVTFVVPAVVDSVLMADVLAAGESRTKIPPPDLVTVRAVAPLKVIAPGKTVRPVVTLNVGLPVRVVPANDRVNGVVLPVDVLSVFEPMVSGPRARLPVLSISSVELAVTVTGLA